MGEAKKAEKKDLYQQKKQKKKRDRKRKGKGLGDVSEEEKEKDDGKKGKDGQKRIKRPMKGVKRDAAGAQKEGDYSVSDAGAAAAAAAAAAAISLSSSQKRRNRRKDKLRGNAQAKEVKHAKCKRGHTMAMRTDNPKGYLNDACCDVCALPNLVKKCDFYFHCAFRKWDVCPNCIIKYEDE